MQFKQNAAANSFTLEGIEYPRKALENALSLGSLKHYPPLPLLDYLAEDPLRSATLKTTPYCFLDNLFEKDPQLTQQLLEDPYWREVVYGDMHHLSDPLVIYLLEHLIPLYPMTPPALNTFLQRHLFPSAVRMGNGTPNLEIVKLAIARGAKLSKLHQKYLFSYSDALFEGLSYLIDIHGEREGIPFFHMLVKRNETKLIREWIARGVNIHKLSKEGVSALHVAAGSDHLEIASLLLVEGADVNQATSSGITPLHLAAMRRNLPMVILLTTSGADPNLLDFEDRSPFHCAYLSLYPSLRPFSVASFLFEHGADPLISQSALYPLAQLKLFTKWGISEEVQNRMKELHLRKMNAHVNHIGGPSLLVEGEKESDFLLEGFHSFLFFKPILAALKCEDLVIAMKGLEQDVLRSDAEILSQIQNGETTLIPCGYRRHASMLIFIDGYVFVCDTNQDRPIQAFLFDREKLDEATIFEIREAKTRKPVELLPGLEPSVSKHRLINRFSSIRTQTVGNCTWACLEAALYVLFMVRETKGISGGQEMIKQMVDKDSAFRNIILKIQTHLLDKYLRFHESNKSPFLPDFPLLKRIRGMRADNLDSSMLERLGQLIHKHPRAHFFEERHEAFLERMNTYRDGGGRFNPDRYDASLAKDRIDYITLFKVYCK
ncbi:MAG: ankyrin repeat domain-containing protein [Verrucomicrobia bacterium]|nr:ankyrin repeat domain-containing protein [Verrucomicrobiota bacterium]